MKADSAAFGSAPIEAPGMMSSQRVFHADRPMRRPLADGSSGAVSAS